MRPEEHDLLRLDAAGYALGTLEPDDRARFEAHLATCEECRAELSALEPVAALGASAAPPTPAPPPGLGVRTLLAVERAAAGETARPREHDPRPHRSRGRIRTRSHGVRFALATAVVAATLAALLVGRNLDRSELPGGDPGPLEAVATLAAPEGGGEASIDVFFTGIGRVVELDTNDLPILPKSEYYELWFVGPRDRPGSPDRISAGTFHPDEDGRSKVTFAAAVDPKKYPTLAVTAEPGDGDPSPSRPDVLRGTGRLR